MADIPIDGFAHLVTLVHVFFTIHCHNGVLFKAHLKLVNQAEGAVAKTLYFLSFEYDIANSLHGLRPHSNLGNLFWN